jgi:hypothetical protein
VDGWDIQGSFISVTDIQYLIAADDHQLGISIAMLGGTEEFDTRLLPICAFEYRCNASLH